MKIILQPCASPAAREHLNNTIFNNNLTLPKIKTFLNTEELNILEQMYGNNQIMIWGVKCSSKSKWLRIKMGDLVLFSADKKIFSIATVTYKIENPNLANFLWGKDEKQNSWNCIYFLDELINVNIPYEVFNKIVGYSSNYIIQGFNVLSEEKSLAFLDIFDVKSSRYINNDLDDKKYKELIKKQYDSQFNKGMNIEQKSYRRAEQGFLRNKLFGNKFVEKCAICGREFPIEFLWCAHIKKRSLCSEEELIDFENIVTPMCKLGCDDLFEKGYLGIENGVVSILKYTKNSTLDSYMDALNGKKCSAFNLENKKYFDFHILNNKIK